LHPKKLQHLDQLATLVHQLVHSDNRRHVALYQLQKSLNNGRSDRPKHWHDSPKAEAEKRVSPTLRGRAKCRRAKCGIYFREKTCSIALLKNNLGEYFFSTSLMKNRHQLTVEGWTFSLINPQPNRPNPQPRQNIFRKSQIPTPKMLHE
jgi:hypothetical protein